MLRPHFILPFAISHFPFPIRVHSRPFASIRVHSRSFAVKKLQGYRHSRARLSITIVTGPSFTKATFISAPKTPRPAGFPTSNSSAAQNPS